MALKLPEGLRPVADFAVQVAVGAAAFAVVMVVAVLLAGFIRALSLVPFAPIWLTAAAEWTEKGLFAIDLFGLGLFLLGEVAKLVRGLWKELIHGR